MPEQTVDNSPILRRVIQTVCDVAHRPLRDLRILDLGSAHGIYAIELARRGATVLGLEGRTSWVEVADRCKQQLGLANVDFVRDDVRELSRSKYGDFDVVLCLGLLYHLDAPDVFDCIQAIADVCSDFAVFETHFAHAPTESRAWRDHVYWGDVSIEHAEGATREDKLANLGASLDNDRAFWLTQASLCNALRHAGFSSVYECRNPLANVYVGPEREFKMWRNRITLVAVKGRAVELRPGGLPQEPEADWPEDPDARAFQPARLSISPSELKSS